MDLPYLKLSKSSIKGKINIEMKQKFSIETASINDVNFKTFNQKETISLGYKKLIP